MTSIRGSWVERNIEYDIRIHLLLVLSSYIQSLFQNFFRRFPWVILLRRLLKKLEESAKIFIANKELRYFYFIDKQNLFLSSKLGLRI